MFGTNLPNDHPGQVPRGLGDLELDDEALGLFLSGTRSAVYKL
jgi:hypothetical protein